MTTEELIEPTKDLGDYLDMLRRRKSLILAVVTVLFTIAVLAALLWPPTYQSTSTILIQEQEVPPSLVRSTVTSYAMQRVQVISQRVMTRSNLLQLIDKYNLYPERRKTETTEDLINDMRDDISLQPISADVIDPRSGQPTKATIAFTLGFEGRNPGKVQQVANELTSLYMNENIKTRTEKAGDTYTFLNDEAKRLKAHLDALDKEIAELKEKNLDRLPELQDVNVQLMERTERDLMDAETQIRSLQSQRVYLTGQLALINPNQPVMNDNGVPIMDPSERLRLLRNQYLSATAQYGADYPDVVRMRREIQQLEKSTGAPPDLDEQRAALKQAQAQLAKDRAKYSDQYPDVVRLQKKVAALTAALAASEKQAKSPSAAADATDQKPTNPAYITLKAQLENVDGQLKSLRTQRDQMKVRLASFDKRLMETPQVARRFEALKLDRDSTAKQYQDLLAKQMDAGLAQQLEKDQKGERFVLIDPPEYPQKPIKPNRLAILILGFILSLGGGVGLAATAESMDHSVRGIKGIAAVLEMPPLAAIPYFENTVDHTRRRRFRMTTVVLGVCAVVAALLLIQFFWMPLDVLWFKSMDKLNNYLGN